MGPVMAKLIVEEALETRYITEEKNGVKNLYIEGIFMQAGVKNRNGRVYPEAIMENEVGRYIKEKVQAGKAYGELDHPPEPTVKLQRASHIIQELKMDGKDVYGKAIVINEGNGKIVRGLIEAGANLGVSSRGLGSLKPVNGIMEVQDDFRIMTAADIVSDPSAPNAFVQGIFENADWLYENGMWIKAEATKQQMKKMTNRQLEEAKFRLFKAFLNEVAKN